MIGGVVGWLGRLLTGLLVRVVFASLLLGVVVGTPVGLWTQFGWPLPDHLPTVEELLVGLRGRVTDGLLVNTLVVVCWLLWSQFSVNLLVEVVAQLRGLRAWRVPLAGPLQPLAAHLVGALLVSVLAVGQRTSTPPAPAVPISAPAPTSHIQPLAVIPPQPDAAEDDQECADLQALPRHTVRPYQTLWGIAEIRLGDGLRWREIFDLNAGHRQPDGRRLTDPDLIRPDWVLLLPGDAPPRPDQPEPSAPSPAPGEPDPHVPMSPEPGQPHPPSPPAPATPEPSSPPPADERPPPDDPVGIQLPSGSVIWAPLVFSTLLALEIVRRRRRRHRQPAEPTPGIRHHRTPQDINSTLRRLEFLARQPPATQTPGGHANGPDPGPETISGRIERQLTTQPAPPHRGMVPLGQRGGHQVMVDLVQLGGLSLTGPGAPGVARAVVTAALSDAHPDAEPVQVLLPGERLLGRVGPFRGLRRHPRLEAALQDLEVEVVRRTRLLERAQAATLAELHARDPAPVLLLVIDEIPPTQAGRLQTVLGLGRRLGILALGVGVQAPTGARLAVTQEHTATAAHPRDLATLLVGAELFTLTEHDATAILGAVAASRAPEEPEAPRALPPPASGGQPVPQPPAAGTAAQPPTAPDRQQPAPVTDRPFAVPVPPHGSPPPPVQVQVLGGYQIRGGGTEIRSGMRGSAWELLLYFLLHPEGATLDTAVAEIWPDTRLGRESGSFWNALTSLRKTLRAAAGIDDLVVIQHHDDGRYRADPATIDADLWRFQAALHQAAKAPDTARRIQALQRAASAYRGDLAGGAYEWAETDRQSLRTSAADALTRLAELHQATGDRDAAIAALQQATEVDPTAEEIYRRLMRLQADHQDFQAAQRTYRRLEHHLFDLGVDPTPETQQLLQDLAREEQRRTRRERARAARARAQTQGSPRRAPPRQR